MKENKRILKRKEKGITLIALVITIIVLLILAGVSIAMLTGENGILTQAQRAKEETEDAQKNEEGILEGYEQYIEGSTNGGTLTKVTGKETTNTTVYDSLGNKIVVPAGFRIINPGDNVEDGIVIEDVSHEATAGSQFVWIPVGTIKTNEEEKTITLSRYTFDSNGNPTDYGHNAIADGSDASYNYQELNNGGENTVAKENIESEQEGFRGSAIKNGGYYIGRYEARTATERKAETDSLTQISEKPEDYVYNYVTQLKAAELSRNMYNDENFESDLMNSYAWDTAIDFLQKCDDRVGEELKPYSQQNSLNQGNIAETGTNNQERQDVICNIYDMASNCAEWTTETYSYASSPCVTRGGGYNYIYSYLVSRYYNTISTSYPFYSFRPLLYL